jgi:hypothetical protein
MKEQLNGQFDGQFEDSTVSNLNIEAELQPRFNRRRFLRHAATGLLGVALLPALAACSGRSDQPGEAAQANLPNSASTGESACNSADALTNQEKSARAALRYVDQSSDTQRVCANCRFFKAPEAGASCGGCEVVTGPIAPQGYCTVWAAA